MELTSEDKTKIITGLYKENMKSLESLIWTFFSVVNMFYALNGAQEKVSITGNTECLLERESRSQHVQDNLNH